MVSSVPVHFKLGEKKEGKILNWIQCDQQRMSSNNGSNHNGFCIGSFSTENDIDFWLKKSSSEWSCYREIPSSPCKKTTFPSNSMLRCTYVYLINTVRISLNGRAATRRPIRTLFLDYFWNVANKMIYVHIIKKTNG